MKVERVPQRPEQDTRDVRITLTAEEAGKLIERLVRESHGTLALLWQALRDAGVAYRLDD